LVRYPVEATEIDWCESRLISFPLRHLEERGRLVRPRFAFGDRNADTIKVSICRIGSGGAARRPRRLRGLFIWKHTTKFLETQ
jgi:hypothetical protein